MKVLLLLFLFAATLIAQDPRFQFGDDLRWAQPEWDDSAWRVPVGGRLDGSHQPGDGYVWFRYRVSVPANATGPLALRLDGENVHGVWLEAWVNGKKVGGYGNSEPVREPGVWLGPQAYDLPDGIAQPGTTAVVALRIWKLPNMRKNISVVPVFIGARELVHLQSLQRFWKAHEPWLLQHLLALLRLCLGLLLFFSYLFFQRRIEILWLGCLTITLSAQHFNANVLYDFFWTDASPFLASTIQCFVNVFGNIAYSRYILHAILFPKNWVFNGITALMASLPFIGFVLVQIDESKLNNYLSRLMFLVVLLMVLLLVAVGYQIVRLWKSGSDNKYLAFGIAFDLLVNFFFLIGQFPTLFWLGKYRMQLQDVFSLLTYITVALLIVRRARRESRELLQMESELSAAQRVQKQLLSSMDVRTSIYSLEAASEPARHVGGDFHLTFPSEDGSVLLLVGDVSGKGLSAALVVAVVVGALGDLDSWHPGGVLLKLNRSVMGKTEGGFVTCLCAWFRADGTVLMANAGHVLPYVEGRPWELESGLPLGITREVEYPEQLVSGDRFVFLSDGVVEATNAKGELFGFDRTQEMISKPARDLVAIAKSWGQTDDITVVTVQRLATEQSWPSCEQEVGHF